MGKDCKGLDTVKALVLFFYEVGALRKIGRAHQEALLTTDLTDNISSHSFRTALIGAMLARELGADVSKVVIMCLIHDLPEARSGDHNWIHKRYVSVDEPRIRNEQFGILPEPHAQEILALSSEYARRESREAQIAKDADLLDQILLLKEYEQQGNKEAKRWLHTDDGENIYPDSTSSSPGDEEKKECRQISLMAFELTRDIARKANHHASFRVVGWNLDA